MDREEFEQWLEDYWDEENEMDLNEESLRTKGGGEYGVDWSIVKSKEYTKRFEAIANDEKTRNLIAKHARNALVNRNGKNTEELYAVNLSTGKDVTRIVDQHYKQGVKRTEKFNADIERAETKGYSILLIHNHPSSSVPSLADINELLNHKSTSGITVGHNGNIYYYSKPDRKIEKEDLMVALMKKKADNINKQYEDAMYELARQFGFEFKVL